MISSHWQGQPVGPYVLHEFIAEGGMGAIYSAYPADGGEVVAVKVVTGAKASEMRQQPRFMREVRAARQLDHPHILRVLDFGFEGDALYMVMPCIPDGWTLRHQLEQGGPLTAAQTALAARQIGAALDYAHAQGIIHRDVKPGNIMVGEFDRHYYLADFGLVKLNSASLTTLTLGEVVGTAAYMSPEQAGGQPVDGRSDLYSLGVTLYQCLLGSLPYRAETNVAMVSQHIHALPIPPRNVTPEFPAALEAVLLRALEKQPDDRYQSGAELADAFQAALDEAPAALRERPLASATQIAAAEALTNRFVTEVAEAESQQRRKRRAVLGWLLVIALACTLAGLVSRYVVEPLRQQIVTIQQTAEALRGQGPLVVTQVITVETTGQAGEPAVIVLTATPFPSDTPTGTATQAGAASPATPTIPTDTPTPFVPTPTPTPSPLPGGDGGSAQPTSAPTPKGTPPGQGTPGAGQTPPTPPDQPTPVPPTQAGGGGGGGGGGGDKGKGK